MSPETGAAVPRRDLAPGYSVPRVLNGGWQLSRGHRAGAVDPDAAIDHLSRLVDRGFTAFDCGDIYLGVETLLGGLRRVRPGIQVHTKLVPDRDALARIDRPYVERIIDRSLRRLGVEALDLVQLHWWDYGVPRYVETALWLDELRRAGKIRLLGATNFDVPRLAEIVDAGVPVVVHQVQYSLLDRRPERGMVRFCRERGIHLLTYGVLGGGFLSDRHLGAPLPAEPLATRSLVKYHLILEEMGGWSRFQDLLAVLARIAARHGVSVANVALRWTLDRAGVAAAILGAFDSAHLEENVRTFAFRLDPEDLQALEPFHDAGPAGDVYAAERAPGSRHAAILRTDLNREADAGPDDPPGAGPP